MAIHGEVGPSKKPKKKHDRPSLQLSSSPVSFFFHGNSAGGASAPVRRSGGGDSGVGQGVSGIDCCDMQFGWAQG
ncbi:hypothetical protein MRB53_003163 [Persea americana]|uniref:Uncharacterized protein n=1 Tax=Persea americana TaxID=3435 RepID=A0ACC2MWM7_PERAE|nr:hypothetical protein MRB53_003163 [Persea americana]